MKAISASQANRDFSSLLRDVAQGREVIVTSRGKPVAKVVPIGAGGASRKRAHGALMARLATEPVSGRPRDWSRAQLYEDDDA
jgi:prevent-host-death family protein